MNLRISQNIRLLALLFTVFTLPSLALGFSSGPPDNRCGDPPSFLNCTACHTSFPINSGPGYISLTGLPAAYTPGTTYPISVTTSLVGQTRWGFELTVIKADGSRGGQLAVTDATNTQISVNVTLNRDYLKHTTAGTFPGTPTGHTWTMNWTAPAAGVGTVTFYLAGNAANNSGTNAGDYIFILNANVHEAGALPQLDVQLTPSSPPVMVPAAGGSFSFTAGVQRTVGPQSPFAVWARVKNPDGSYTTPTLGPVTINPPVGVSVSRARTQNVPGAWSTGFYANLGYANTTFTYPAIDSSSFYFTKLAVLGDEPFVWESTCTGEPFPGEEAIPMGAGSSLPSAFSLGEATPNPFNPTTAISYRLSASSRVSLKVYDVSGRLSATLVNGLQEAGSHEAAFDGTGLASGMYLYRLEAAGQAATGKMMLVK